MSTSLRQTLRSLLRSPYFTLAAVLSLGVAIGGCTSVLAIVRALAAPVAYPEPDRLVEIWSTQDPVSLRRYDVVSGDRMRLWSQQEFRSIESLAARASISLVLGGDTPERIEADLVSGKFFEVLGVPAQLGRPLGADDDRPGAERAAVISASLWEDGFGEDPAAIGSVISLSGESYAIVGIMPHSFDGGVRVWVPAAERLGPENFGLPVGRLRPGATLEQAAVEVQQRAAAEIAYDSTLYGGMGAVAEPFGVAGPSAFASVTVWVLIGIVGVVLLLALTNLTTLFLTRAADRGRTSAVRIALGANTRQLGQGLLLESLVLAVTGAGLGVLIATWGVDLVRVATSEVITIPRDVSFDLPVFLFAAALGLLAATLLGLEPLRHLRRMDVRSLLVGGAMTMLGPHERSTRNFMVAVQIGLTTTLACGAGVLSIAHGNWARTNVGYDAANVVAVFPDYEVLAMGEPEQWALGTAVAERLARFPGVESATVWRQGVQRYPAQPEDIAIFEGGAADGTFHVRLGLYRYYDVGADFFETLGVPIVAGRDFGPDDGPGSVRVGIVTENGANAWWPGQSPLGRRLRLGESGEWITVVGVVPAVAWIDQMGRFFSNRAWLDRPELQNMPLLFRPLAQGGAAPVGWTGGVGLGFHEVVVGTRTSGDPARVTAALVSEMAAAAPNLPLTDVGTLLDVQLGQGAARELVVFGALVKTVAGGALLLALLGVIGVAADGVVRRTREIGIRKALGARWHQVTLTLAKESFLTTTAGLAAGFVLIVLTVLLSRQLPVWRLEDLLAGASMFDWRVLTSVSLSILLVTATTSLLCARRGERIEPAAALRSD